MISNSEFVLEECLELLAQGETLQDCLARYPEQAAELEPLLAAALRLQNAGEQVSPSLLFKSRTRAQLRAHMDAHPRKLRQGFWFPRFSLAMRVVSGLAALLLACTITGTALAQSALPGETLYSWKLTSERAWRTLSPDPVGVDLARAERRIDEALAVSSNVDAQGIALHDYQNIVADLEQYEDLSVQERISSGLKIQQEKLKKSGLELPSQAGTHPNVKTP
jgi:hypothetical protein